MINFNLYVENEYNDWQPNVEDIVEKTKAIFNYYMACPEIAENCCLNGYDYETVAFDFLFCNAQKTHVINRDYRNKDYPADIITFAVFADSSDDEKFVLDFLHEHHILLVHGGGFNWNQPDHFRIVYLPKMDDLKQTAKKMREFLATYRQK